MNITYFNKATKGYMIRKRIIQQIQDLIVAIIVACIVYILLLVIAV